MSLNSPFGNMFQAIANRIQTQLPDIAYIDQDMGQLDGTSSLTAPVLPCVLIDFKDFTFDDLSQNVQMAQGSVTIKLAYAQDAPVGTPTTEIYTDQALDYYETEWTLNKALNGWSPGDNYSVLSRRNAESLNTTDNTRVRLLTYKVEFEDYSTKFVVEGETVMHPGLDFQGDFD